MLTIEQIILFSILSIISILMVFIGGYLLMAKEGRKIKIFSLGLIIVGVGLFFIPPLLA